MLEIVHTNFSMIWSIKSSWSKKKRWKVMQKYSISYIGYMAIKEYLNIYSVNLLYLTFRYVNETLKKLIEIDI